MARPTKSVKVLSDYSQTKAEIKAREEMEESLKGEGLPSAPQWLSEEQKEIFVRITECLEKSEMLAVNDEWLLTQTAIAIDRLNYIEMKMNSDNNCIFDKDLQSARNGYIRDFFRGCNELCLSPQARAKLANTAAGKEKKKSLAGIIDEAKEL